MTAQRRSTPARWSTALVAGWARSYTLGLPPEVRRDRRDEIASDLWEHAHDSAIHRTVDAEILTRGLLGIPADLAWRLERSRLARLPGWVVASILGLLARLEGAARWFGRRGLPGFTTAAAILTGLIGVLVIVTAPSNDSGTPTASLVWWGALLLVGALLIGIGGRLIGSRVRLGATFVVLGSALLGLLLWPTVIGPITALTLSWRAAIRVRAARRQRRTESMIDL